MLGKNIGTSSGMTHRFCKHSIPGRFRTLVRSGQSSCAWRLEDNQYERNEFQTVHIHMLGLDVALLMTQPLDGLIARS